jgi:hypothetical protein
LAVVFNGFGGELESLVKAGSMITQINFSKNLWSLPPQDQSIVSFGIQFLFLIILFPLLSIHRTSPSFHSYHYSSNPLIDPQAGFGPFDLEQRHQGRRECDLLLMTFLMFLTPVLYAKPEREFWQKSRKSIFFIIWFQTGSRLEGKISEPMGFFISSCLADCLCHV